MMDTELTVRKAVLEDVSLVLNFIRELAEYEKLADQCVATKEQLAKYLFGSNPAAEVFLAFEGVQPVGFCLFFSNFSTFLGKPGIYLEDLFVKSEFRGKGYGKRLLVEIAKVAIERGCGRFEWSVLDWNEPSILFYRKLGAIPMEEWTGQRVEGEALLSLANSL